MTTDDLDLRFAAARELTMANATAACDLVVDHSYGLTEAIPAPGLATRALLTAGKLFGRGMIRVLGSRVDYRHQGAQGVIDLAGGRCMLDFGSYATLYADGLVWAGRSGRPLYTLTGTREIRPSPLWLIQVLSGTHDVSDLGVSDIDGRASQRLKINTSLADASVATSGGLHSPSRDRFEDLLNLELHVWVDETHIRRIRYETERETQTLSLWDFGRSLDDVDWARLPDFN